MTVTVNASSRISDIDDGPGEFETDHGKQGGPGGEEHAGPARVADPHAEARDEQHEEDDAAPRRQPHRELEEAREAGMGSAVV